MAQGAPGRHGNPIVTWARRAVGSVHIDRCTATGLRSIRGQPASVSGTAAERRCPSEIDDGTGALSDAILEPNGSGIAARLCFRSTRPLEPSESLEQPERGERTNRVRRYPENTPLPTHAAHRPSRQSQHSQHRSDEREVPALDSHVEREQRERNVTLREPYVSEGAREAESVEQAEGERHHPRPAHREADAAAFAVHDLRRE